MARQTKERAEQTREAILDAACKVFFRRGVARSSLEEVAREAGVTRGAVYWHFTDKLDLFTALEDRLQEPLEQMITDLVQSSPSDPLRALEETTVRRLELFASDESMRMLLTVVLLHCDFVEEMAPALDRHAQFQRRFHDSLICYFRTVVPPPGIGCDWTPETAANVCHAVAHGVLLRWLRFPDGCPLQPDGVAVVRSLMTSLRRNWVRQD